MESIIELLRDNALVNLVKIVTAVVGILQFAAGLLRDYGALRRGSYIVCTEQPQTVHPASSGTEEKHLVTLRLRNIGVNVIHNPEIDIAIKGPKNVRVTPKVSPATYPPLQDCKHYKSVVTGNPCVVSLKLDYINDFSKHQEQISLNLLCDKEVESLEIHGGGPGWSVQFRSWKEIECRRRQEWLVSIMALLIASVYALHTLIPTETSLWRIVWVVVLVALVCYGIANALLDRLASRMYPGPYVPIESTFGRVLMRLLIRGFLALFLAVLIYAAAVTYGQQRVRAESRVFDLLCGVFHRFCQELGLR